MAGPAVQVRQPQPHWLAPPCSAVRRQADQQQRLLSGEKSLGASFTHQVKLGTRSRYKLSLRLRADQPGGCA